MFKQNAQGVVEFALVLPLFLLLIIGTIYFGMAFSDYLAINNAVRSIAHEASMGQSVIEYRKAVINNTKDMKLVSDIFTWQPDSATGHNNVYLTVNFDNMSRSVVVVARPVFNKDSAIGNAFCNLAGQDIGDGINIRYSMYSDVRR